MLLALINLLMNLFGIDFARARRLALIAVAVAVLLVLIGFVALFRSCGKRQVKIDESQIQKINQANERERKLEIEKVILENANTIKTVDERTTIAETNVVERNRLLDEKIKDADKKIAEAKQQKGDVTSEELEKILLGLEVDQK